MYNAITTRVIITIGVLAALNFWALTLLIDAISAATPAASPDSYGAMEKISCTKSHGEQSSPQSGPGYQVSKSTSTRLKTIQFFPRQHNNVTPEIVPFKITSGLYFENTTRQRWF